jgi:hypothetical protein
MVGGGGAFDPLDETNRAAPHAFISPLPRQNPREEEEEYKSCSRGVSANPANVRDALDARRRKYAMDAFETLQRLTDHARASIGDFLDDACTIDLKMADEQGKLPLVKELTERIIPTEDGDIRQTTIKLHDAQAALLALMKHHGLLKDDPKGEGPKTQRELDEMFTAEIRRVKGPEAGDAIAEVLRQNQRRSN